MKNQTGEATKPLLVPLTEAWSYCCFTKLVLPHLMTGLSMNQGNLTVPFPCSKASPQQHSLNWRFMCTDTHVFSSSCSHNYFLRWHIAHSQTNSWHSQLLCIDAAIQAKNICLGHVHRRLLKDQRDKHTFLIQVSGLHLVAEANTVPSKFCS